MKKFLGLSKTASAIMLGLGLISVGSNSSNLEITKTYPTTDRPLTYAIVDTGQADCYDGDGEGGEGSNTIVCGSAYHGQDAEYGKNNDAFNFEYLSDDNGDIIYETKEYDNSIIVTKAAVIIDNNTSLMWEGVPTNERFSYEEAEAYIAALNEDEFQGYSDWRMPTAKELYSIADFSTGWPYLDMDYFTLPTYEENDFNPDDFDAKDEQYWSQAYVGNTYEAGSAGAFGLNHGTGHIKVYPATTTGAMGKAVRAVRGTENVYGINSFTITKGNTVTDSATGLMWTQDDSATGELLLELKHLIAIGKIDISSTKNEAVVGAIGLLNWEDALAFAENATFGGHTDWRLPTIKELESITDYNHSPTAGFYNYSNASDEQSTDDEDIAIDLIEEELTGEAPTGGAPTESNDPLVWYDACDDTIAEANNVENNKNDPITATNDECALRGPAIDTRYFNATSINALLEKALTNNLLTTESDLYVLYNTVTVQAGLNDYGYYWSSTSTRYGTSDEIEYDEDTGIESRDTDYAFAWYATVGTAVNSDGEDYHGAGAIRYDVKDETSGAVGEDAERVFNYIRLVRDAN